MTEPARDGIDASRDPGHFQVPEHLLRPVADGPGSSAAQLRAMVRRASRRASTTRPAELLADLYTALLAVVVTLLVLAGARGSVGALIDAGAFSSSAAAAGAPGAVLAWSGVLLVVGALVGLVCRLGPLSLPPPQASWWLHLPVDRGALLRPVLLRRVVLVALVAAAGSAGVLFVLAPTATGPGALGAAAVAAAGVSVVLVAAGVLLQATRGTAQPLVRVADGLVLLSLLVVVAAAATGDLPGAPGRGPDVLGAATGGGAVALIAVALAVAAGAVVSVLPRRLGGVPGPSLSSSGALSAHVAGSSALLDTRALGRALSDPPASRPRRAPRRTRHWTRSHVVRGPRTALVVADLLGVLRTPRRVITALVLATFPAGVASAVGDSRTALLLTLLACTYGAVTTLAEPVRVRVLVPSIDSALPVTPGAAAAAHLAALTLLATSVCAVSALALGLLAPGALPAGLVLATGPSLAAAALRGATRPELDPGTASIATEAGPLPIGLLASLTKGPDFALVAMLPLIIAAVALSSGHLLPGVELRLAAVALLLAAVLGGAAARGSRPPAQTSYARAPTS